MEGITKRSSVRSCEEKRGEAIFAKIKPMRCSLSVVRNDPGNGNVKIEGWKTIWKRTKKLQ